MLPHGFLRVAAASPVLRVADCAFNADRILALMRRAEAESVAVLVFPELSLTGYTCADLFQQSVLQRGALDALEHLLRAGGEAFGGVALVGLPLAVDDQVFNCAAVLHRGRLLGLVPKSFIPNYKEFYERRWFAAAAAARSRQVHVLGATVPFGADRLFTADGDGRDARRRNLRGPVGAHPAQFEPGPGRGHGARQPVGQQRGHRQGRLPPATGGQPVRTVHGRLRLRLLRRLGIDHGRGVRRPLPDRRERRAPGRVAPLPARRRAADRRRRSRPPPRGPRPHQQFRRRPALRRARRPRLRARGVRALPSPLGGEGPG